MANRMRLIHARSCFEAHAALPFVLELDPALQHVDELEFGTMQVGFSGEGRARHGTNDVRYDSTARGAFDAQVAILEERAQAALEVGIACVGDGEVLRRHLPILFAVSFRSRPPSDPRRGRQASAIAAIETFRPGTRTGSLAPCRAGGSEGNHLSHSS